MEKMHCSIGVLEEKNKHLQKTIQILKAKGFAMEEENRTFKSESPTNTNTIIILLLFKYFKMHYYFYSDNTLKA